MTRISFDLPLNPLETGTSYTSRLTRLVGRQSPFDFCTDLGLDWTRVVRGDADQLETIAEIGGANQDDLMHWSVRARGYLKFRVCGEDVINKTMTRSRLRVCPHCIAEDIAAHGPAGVWRRIYWQLCSIRSCEQHGTLLLTLPCDKFTIGNYDIVGKAQRHEELILSHRRDGGTAPFTAFESYLKRRLAGTRNHPWLDALPIHLACKFCEMLGATLLFERAPKLRKLTAREMQSAGQAGFEIARWGEASVKAAMVELRTDTSDPGLSRHKSDLGCLYTWLSRAPDECDIAPIKTLVREHVFDSYPVREGISVLGLPCPGTRVYTIQSATEEKGIIRNRLNRMMVASGRAQFNGSHKRVAGHDPIARADLDEMISAADSWLKFREARQMLGVSEDTFKAMTRAGLITRHTNPVDPLRRYAQDELQDLIDDLSAKTLRNAAADTRLKPIVTVGKTAAIRISSIIERIRSGALTRCVWSHPATGLATLEVDMKELRDVLQDDPKAPVTLARGTKILRMEPRALKLLLSAGLLTALHGRAPFNKAARSGIEPSSLSAFLARYETLGRLAHQYKVPAPALRHRLAEHGIKPVPLPPKHPVIYERAAVQEAAKSKALAPSNSRTHCPVSSESPGGDTKDA